MPLHFIKQLPAQIMLFQQMAEAAHCRLVRYRLAAEIDANKIAHRIHNADIKRDDLATVSRARESPITEGPE